VRLEFLKRHAAEVTVPAYRKQVGATFRDTSAAPSGCTDCQVKPPAACVLNVAGNRESGADGIQNLVMAIMVDVLRTVNPECRGLYLVRE